MEEKTVEDTKLGNYEVENKRWEELISQIDNVDRYIGAQIRKYDYLIDQSFLLSRDDLKQVATISLFESYRKMSEGDEEWTSFVKSFREREINRGGIRGEQN